MHNFKEHLLDENFINRLSHLEESSYLSHWCMEWDRKTRRTDRQTDTGRSCCQLLERKVTVVLRVSSSGPAPRSHSHHASGCMWSKTGLCVWRRAACWGLCCSCGDLDWFIIMRWEPLKVEVGEGRVPVACPACSPCLTALQRAHLSQRLSTGTPLAWRPQPGCRQGWGPALSITVSHGGQGAQRTLLRWARSLKPLWTEVYLLTPESWRPKSVVQDKKGTPHSAPSAELLLMVSFLLFCPVSFRNCLFSAGN